MIHSTKVMFCAFAEHSTEKSGDSDLMLVATWLRMTTVGRSNFQRNLIRPTSTYFEDEVEVVTTRMAETKCIL
jgi:hypothetical protein